MSEKNQRPAYLNIKGRPYSLKTIENALRAEIDSSGQRPKPSGGVVRYSTLEKRGIKWSDIDAAFKSKQVIDGPQCKGLSNFSDKYEIKSTLRSMFAECANVAFMRQRVPLPSHVANAETAEKLEQIDKRLRIGNVPGWKNFMPDVNPVPISLNEFCLATGLIEQQNGQPVLPPTEKLLDNISRLISRP